MDICKITMTRFTTKLQKFDSKLWGHHFPIPATIAEEFIDGNDRRVVCKVNDLHSIQSALMPYPDGYFILVNVNIVKKLKLRIGDDVTLQLDKDHSEYGLPMPESLSALLEQDVEGNGFFEQLTPGKKRTLIYLVGNVKNIDSQLNKGMAILDHLKMENGKLDFKKLNQLIKEYNQRSKLK
jgi:hypothetical protein